MRCPASSSSVVQVTFENPHILLLDEPSNHLDLDAVKALIKVINLSGLPTFIDLTVIADTLGLYVG